MANNGITPKQSRAIAALLIEPNTRQAATAAGISSRQLYRWLDAPEFQAALKQAQADLICAASGRLAVGMDAALNALADLINAAQSEGVKRAAASDWISYALKVRESTDLENRLADLEARIEHG